MWKLKLLLALTLLCQENLGRRFDSQIKQNVDFLTHESAGITNSNKRDYVALQQQNNFEGHDDFNSQFPPLGKPGTTPKPFMTVNPSGNRDYVNPNFLTIGPVQGSQTPQSQQHTGKQDPFPPLGKPGSTPKPFMTVNPSGKRDYVNTNFPTLKPVQGSQTPQSQQHTGKHDPFPPITPAAATQKTPSTVYNNGQASGKRDYVNPNHRTSNSPQQQTGKVKDLINFFGGNNTPQSKMPSYSSILNRGNNGKPYASAAMTGALKPTSVSTTSPSTNKRPTTPVRPTTMVLPSSIVNNNKNNKNTNSNSFTDAELQALSEELLKKDVNNAAKYLTVNYQAKTSSSSKEDKALQPLFTVGPEVWNIATVQKFVPLLDNYERDTLVNEYVTPQERNEENAFMDAIMSTAVIRHLMNAFRDKGYVTPDPKQQRDFLKQLWFSLYSRGKGKISSSGFEHIFVSELKNGEVSGLHNWIYFAKEEAANRINYLGYLQYTELNDKGAIMKLHFNQQGVDKPVDTMFIGTSPELEIALYTLCFVTRADNDCNIKLANKDLNIVTHTFRYRSKNLIGSAYPQIV